MIINKYTPPKKLMKMRKKRLVQKIREMYRSRHTRKELAAENRGRKKSIEDIIKKKKRLEAAFRKLKNSNDFVEVTNAVAECEIALHLNS